jgi:capsular polysaccharide transport system permease protein
MASETQKLSLVDTTNGPLRPGPKPGAPLLEERALAKGEKPPAPLDSQAQSAAQAKVAAPAHLKARHRGQMLSFVLLVAVPLLVIGVYLFALAKDQYASTTGFSVQREEGASASDFLGIIPGLGGGSGASDTDVLYEFIQSQEIVARIDARLDLRGHYSQYWNGYIWNTDKVFSIWPDPTIEDLLWFWKRVVRISYDKSTGLIELQVFAFDPDYAQAMAREVVAESQEMINTLSNTARADSTRYAFADLEEALDRLKAAREALTSFRTRTQIVDPQADLQGRLGVMSNLQQQLAQSLIDYDLLLGAANVDDPRVRQAQRRISVIRERIASERASFTSSDITNGATGEDYPSLIAEFERLSVDREYAEEAYRAALTALDVARANAARQSRYLATYIDPTKAQSSQYPERWIILGLSALFLTMGWAICTLIYYSIRDRR